MFRPFLFCWIYFFLAIGFSSFTEVSISISTQIYAKTRSIYIRTLFCCGGGLGIWLFGGVSQTHNQQAKPDSLKQENLHFLAVFLDLKGKRFIYTKFRQKTAFSCKHKTETANFRKNLPVLACRRTFVVYLHFRQVKRSDSLWRKFCKRTSKNSFCFQF